MRLYVTWAIGGLCVTLCACGSKELTRPKAAQVIELQEQFAAPLEAKIPVGHIWYDPRNLEYLDKEYPITLLVQGGLLTFQPTGKHAAGWINQYVAVLTPQGKEAAKTWVGKKEETKGIEAFGCYMQVHEPVPCDDPDRTIYTATIAHRHVSEVTGIITDSGGKEAAADFTWQWIPTIDGKKIYGANSFAKGGFKAKAGLQLYDDGWRVTAVKLDATNPF